MGCVPEGVKNHEDADIDLRLPAGAFNHGPDPGGGIPLTVDGEERVITQVAVRDGHWHSGDRRLTRSQQEELTRRAKAIIEEDRRAFQQRFPRRPPAVSIRECQEAIRIGGGIRDDARGRGAG